MGEREDYSKTIKQGASHLGTSLAMASIVSKVPILANPFLYKITEYFVDEIIDSLILKTEFGIFFTYVDLRVSKQGRQFYDSIVKREAAVKGGNAEEIQRAEDDQVRAFAEFASLRS